MSEKGWIIIIEYKGKEYKYFLRDIYHIYGDYILFIFQHKLFVLGKPFGEDYIVPIIYDEKAIRMIMKSHYWIVWRYYRSLVKKDAHIIRRANQMKLQLKTIGLYNLYLSIIN